MEENLNLIRKIAWSFHNKTGIDWNDLFQEAAEGYCKGMKTYSPDKGSLSTHMWHSMTNQLLNYLKEERIQTGNWEGIQCAYHNTINPTNSFWESLSLDAQEIAKAIQLRPEAFVCLPIDVAHERITYIMRRRGWSNDRIQRGMKDIIYCCERC